jgi:hypothetical protein
MKTSTSIRTEYAPLALKPDGTWRQIHTAAHSAAIAEAKLKQYQQNAERTPLNYMRYEQYRIGQRTVITTVEEWQEVQP